MKTAAFLALLVALPLTTTVHAAPPAVITDIGSPDTRAAITTALDVWRNAVIAEDRAALEQVYHEDLIYGHSDGHVADRTEQIDRTIDPDRDFSAVDIEHLVIRAYGDVAYVTATYTFHIQPVQGESRQARLPALDVWTRDKGHWRLIARQLTRATP